MRAWAIIAVLAAGEASAHDADVIYVAARSTAAGAIEELITMTGATAALLAPIDADGNGELSQADLDARADALRAGVWEQAPLTAAGQRCPRTAERATLRETYVELGASFTCGAGELRQDFRILSVIPTNYRVVLGSQVEGERGKAFAQGTFTTLTIPRPARPGAWSADRFRAAVGDGLRRVLAVDALAFLAVVFLTLSGPRRGALAGVAAVVGVAIGSFASVGDPWPAVALALSGAAVLVLGRLYEFELFGALVGGLALGARAGGGVVSTVVGLALGSAVVVGVACAVLVTTRELLSRREVVGPLWTARNVAAAVGGAAVLWQLGVRLLG